jgi:hypothetical protein
VRALLTCADQTRGETLVPPQGYFCTGAGRAPIEGERGRSQATAEGPDPISSRHYRGALSKEAGGGGVTRSSATVTADCSCIRSANAGNDLQQGPVTGRINGIARAFPLGDTYRCQGKHASASISSIIHGQAAVALRRTRICSREFSTSRSELGPVQYFPAAAPWAAVFSWRNIPPKW